MTIRPCLAGLAKDDQNDRQAMLGVILGSQTDEDNITVTESGIHVFFRSFGPVLSSSVVPSLLNFSLTPSLQAEAEQEGGFWSGETARIILSDRLRDLCSVSRALSE